MHIPCGALSLDARRPPWGLLGGERQSDDPCPECGHERYLHMNEARCIAESCDCQRNVLFIRPFEAEGI